MVFSAQYTKNSLVNQRIAGLVSGLLISTPLRTTAVMTHKSTESASCALRSVTVLTVDLTTKVMRSSIQPADKKKKVFQQEHGNASDLIGTTRSRLSAFQL